MTQERRKKYSSLMDGGMHQLSSSDSDEASTVSAYSGEQDDNTDLDDNHRRVESENVPTTSNTSLARLRFVVTLFMVFVRQRDYKRQQRNACVGWFGSWQHHKCRIKR